MREGAKLGPPLYFPEHRAVMAFLLLSPGTDICQSFNPSIGQNPGITKVFQYADRMDFNGPIGYTEAVGNDGPRRIDLRTGTGPSRSGKAVSPGKSRKPPIWTTLLF